MDDNLVSKLCRMCLQDGATYPLFEKAESGDHALKKLSICLPCEKIEDIDGFPRHICSTCNTTIETFYNFINKYRESSKILENGLKIVKKEEKDYCNSDVQVVSDVEIEISNVKIEPEPFDDGFDDGFDDPDDEKPIYLLKSIKNELKTTKKEPKASKTKKQTGARTNKIASSILEGNFSWNGDKWCMKIGQTTLKRIVTHKEPKPRPQTKVKVPSAPKVPEKKLCDVCGDVFKTQERLSLHKKKVHYKNPVQCTKCPRVCVSEYYLKRHMKRKHENREFVCATCGHAFAYKAELTGHCRNVHDKHLNPRKEWSCKFCDKKYKCQKSILIHERSVHTGLRPAQCTVCGSCFYHEDYLKEHMRLHTGETPFKCPICGRGYAQRGNMKSHLRIHRISELDALTLSKIKPNYLKLLKM